MITYILGGTQQEAAECAATHGLPRTEWISINGPRDLRGVLNVNVWLCGTWKARRDLATIMHALDRGKNRVVYPPHIQA